MTLALLVPVLALVACGDDDREGSFTTEGGTGTTTTGTGTSTTPTTPTTPSGPVAQRFEISEVDFRLRPARFELDEAGTIEFAVTNDGTTLHALEVEGPTGEVETEEIQPGGRATLTVEVEPGEYKLYCPVGDHEQRGMVGELVVGGRSGGGASGGGTTAPETEDEGAPGGY